MSSTNEECRGVMPNTKPKRQESRRRSPKACLSCRARKVRCDVSFVPDACTNCVLDSKQCVVSQRRRRHNRDHGECSARPGSDAVNNPQLAAMDDETSATALTEDYYDTPNLVDTSPRHLSNHDRAQHRPDVTSLYYPFLCISNLCSLHPDDLHHLESQGCLRVPESSCLDELLKGFFRYAHLFLPVINEADFWASYHSPTTGDKTNRVPIVLLSAMLFVACNYVDDSVIQSMDLNTAREAANKFYRKTKLLYDFETESSPLVLAQVCLLLAYWTPQRFNGQGTQWLGRAIQHAQDLVSEVKLPSFPQNRLTQSNLRRVWGCCILSDRINSLYTRRPLIIPSTQEDTESAHQALSRADLSYEIGRSRVYDAEVKQQVIEIQEHMSDLCSILGRVLTLVYPRNGVTTTCRNLLVERGGEYGLRDCKRSLEAWHSHTSSLFPVSRRNSTFDFPILSDDGREHGFSQEEPVELMLSMMYLHYDSATLALCHREMMRLTTNPPPVSSNHGIQESISKHALDMTNRLSYCLQHQYLPKFPNSTIFCMAIPLLLHFLCNINSPLYDELALRKAVSTLCDLRDIRAQRPQHPDWVQKAIECLQLHFRDELDYMVRIIKAANESLCQEFQDIHQEEEQSPVGRQQNMPCPTEENSWMGNWGEFLNTRPKLYARVIETLDSFISCGGPVPEGDTPFSFPGRLKQPGSVMHQYCRPEKTMLPLSPLLSPISSLRNTATTSPSPKCGDEPVSQIDRSQPNAKASFLSPNDLDTKVGSILFQQMISPKSQLNGEIGEILSPMSPNPSTTSQDKVTESESTMLDQPLVCDDRKDMTDEDDFRAVHEFIMEDGQNDDWIGAVLAADLALPA